MPTAKLRSGSIKLQARDIALLQSLLESRVMTSLHISRLHFDDRVEATKKRLQKLKTLGVIAERPRVTFQAAVLFLTKAGLFVLSEAGIMAQYPRFGLPAYERRARVSDITLRHELEVLDVKVAFHTAMLNRQDVSIQEFTTWPLLIQFEWAGTVVKPDGYLRLRERTRSKGGVTHFFVEVDRSTERLETLVARANAYLAYYRSGRFAERNGGHRSAPHEHPFRVLMIFKTDERRNNMAERLLANSPSILTQVHLSTFKDVTNDPMGEVWIRPLDYRDATKGTLFEDYRHNERGYRRQGTRDAFIEANISRRSIIGEREG